MTNSASSRVDFIEQALEEGRRVTRIASTLREIESMMFWYSLPLSESSDAVKVLKLRREVEDCQIEREALQDAGFRQTTDYLEVCLQELTALKKLRVLYEHRAVVGGSE